MSEMRFVLCPHTRARTEGTAVLQGGAEESHSGFLDRAGGTGRGGWRLRACLGSLPERSCSVLRSRSSTTWWAWTGFNSGSLSRTSKRAALVLRAVWRGSGGAVLRRGQVARALAWEPRHRDSQRRLLEEFRAVFLSEGVLGSRGRFAVAHENLDLLTCPGLVRHTFST